MKDRFSLCRLPAGESARVERVAGEPGLRHRLLELGLVPGTELRCLGESPAGDPRAYRVRGTVIALRSCDAEQIAVRREPGPERRRTVALAGNPNVGKSTLFNRLCRMRQHTGNWPGKTVELARGACGCYTLVDLPGTYSLMARSPEEEIAGEYLRSGAVEAAVVVCDAVCLERTLNLALQVMELCPRVLICVNLLDEARRKGLELDLELLQRRLGVPVIGVVAQKKESAAQLLRALDALFAAPPPERPYQVAYPEGAARRLPGQKGEAEQAEELCVTALVRASEELCRGVVRRRDGRPGAEADDRLDRKLDRVLTGRLLAWPLMLLALAGIFWLTVKGANYPSELLGRWLFALEQPLSAALYALGAPDWLRGLLVDGAYRVLAWVVSVMLPPMAIFFPLFTLLEDAGVLPRLAYDLDRPFQRCGACGKQALCMAMGLGCNAAGVTGCRIISSERERLLAVLTNSLVPCNGRFPTLIALSALFWAGAGATLLPALTLTGALALSTAMTLLTNRLLSATLLRGKPSSFVLELPPYRLPRVGQVLLRSLLDRTLFVLGRAAAVAAPAGALLWALAHVSWGGVSLLTRAALWLEPPGRALGFDGAVLLAFVLGLPANEIVLPVALMIYTGGGSLTEPGSLAELGRLLAAQGWTAWTAAGVMLFSLFHWPCSTTLLTVKKETGSWGWTALAALLPTALGLLLCLGLNALHLLLSA